MPKRPHRPRIRALRALAILALLTPLAAAPSTRAATPASGTVTPTKPFTWQGPVATGHNQSYDRQSGEPCGQTDADFCDKVLVLVDPGDFYATHGGGVDFSISGGAGRIELYRSASRPRGRA